MRLKLSVVISNTIMSVNEKLEAIMALLNPSRFKQVEQSEAVEFLDWCMSGIWQYTEGKGWANTDNEVDQIYLTTQELYHQFKQK